MPSSRYEHISDVVDVLIFLAPSSLLDVGCGFGRWGFLAREFLDIFQGRYFKNDWQTRIDGMEVFSDYICPHHKYIYNNIINANLEHAAERIPNYEVIIAGDIIEHIEKDSAKKTLEVLIKRSDKALIVCIPLGSLWPQEEVFNNPHEIHKSVWSLQELKEMGAKYIKLYFIDKRPYAFSVWTDFAIPSMSGHLVKSETQDLSIIKRFFVSLRRKQVMV